MTLRIDDAGEKIFAGENDFTLAAGRKASLPTAAILPLRIATPPSMVAGGRDDQTVLENDVRRFSGHL